jgi:hypothetical protein
MPYQLDPNHVFASEGDLLDLLSRMSMVWVYHQFWPTLLFLAGVAIVTLGVLRWLPGRMPGSLRLVSVALGVALIFPNEATVLDADPRPRAGLAFDGPMTCGGMDIEVCVHPAWARDLGEIVAWTGELLRPIAGMDGTPSRFRQVTFREMRATSYPAANDLTMGDAAFGAGGGGTGSADPWAIALGIVSGPVADGAGDVQTVVAAWLLHEAGLDGGSATPLDWMAGEYGEIGTQDVTTPWIVEQRAWMNGIAAATADFIALDPEVREGWLETNLADLRAQPEQFALEDLP